MNKAEFMAELERLLQGIPDNERTEALNYYEEYFNDAGVENEQSVIAELESPKKVADNIKDDLRANMDATPGNGTNNAYQNGSAYQNGTSYQGSTVYQGNTFYQNGTAPVKKNEGLPTWAIVLIVIGCVICSPAIIGAVGTILGVLAAAFFGLLGIIIGFGAGGLAMLVSGILLTVVGITKLFVGPFAGLLLTGSGLLVLALGILFMMFTIWLCGYALPALCRGIVRLCKKPFEKKGEVK